MHAGAAGEERTLPCGARGAGARRTARARHAGRAKQTGARAPAQHHDQPGRHTAGAPVGSPIASPGCLIVTVPQSSCRASSMLIGPEEQCTGVHVHACTHDTLAWSASCHSYQHVVPHRHVPPSAISCALRRCARQGRCSSYCTARDCCGACMQGISPAAALARSVSCEVSVRHAL